MECVQEDGVWKIWHLHVYSDFAADFGKQLGTPADMPGGPLNGNGADVVHHDAAAQQGAERFGAENQNNVPTTPIITNRNNLSDSTEGR